MDETLLAADRDAAASIAATLRNTAAGLSLDSPVRRLALQSAEHWSSIAGTQARRRLAVVQLREFTEAGS